MSNTNKAKWLTDLRNTTLKITFSHEQYAIIAELAEANGWDDLTVSAMAYHLLVVGMDSVR